MCLYQWFHPSLHAEAVHWRAHTHTAAQTRCPEQAFSLCAALGQSLHKSKHRPSAHHVRLQSAQDELSGKISRTNVGAHTLVPRLNHPSADGQDASCGYRAAVQRGPFSLGICRCHWMLVSLRSCLHDEMGRASRLRKCPEPERMRPSLRTIWSRLWSTMANPYKHSSYALSTQNGSKIDINVPVGQRRLATYLLLHDQPGALFVFSSPFADHFAEG